MSHKIEHTSGILLSKFCFSQFFVTEDFEHVSSAYKAIKYRDKAISILCCGSKMLMPGVVFMVWILETPREAVAQMVCRSATALKLHVLSIYY